MEGVEFAADDFLLTHYTKSEALALMRDGGSLFARLKKTNTDFNRRRHR